MTAAAVVAAILALIRADATVTVSVENLRVRLSESLTAHEKVAARLEDARAKQDHTYAEISTTLSLLKKDMDDLKSRADESRRNRWALPIAILSAVLSLISALVVAFLKRS